MPLKTDYKNFIPSTTTKIHDIKQASDGTIITADVILEDVTVYSQEGDSFGSADINATNAQVNANTDAVALKAPLDSPTFTGTPTAPTAPTGTDTSLLATTEFVQQEIDVHKAESVSQDGGVHGLVIESGTFTPILYGSTTAGTHTYNAAQGFYYKIGDRVFIDIQIILTAKDTNMAGDIRIGGLPFVSSNTPYHQCGASIYKVFGIASDITTLLGFVWDGTDFIQLGKMGSQYLVATDITANDPIFSLSVNYKV